MKPVQPLGLTLSQHGVLTGALLTLCFFYSCIICFLYMYLRSEVSEQYKLS